jgi:outer membrane protein assembly factor BamE (lipoprotein component of BamABCDE complex)
MRPSRTLVPLLLLALYLAGCKSKQLGPGVVTIGPTTVEKIEPGLSRPHVKALLGEPLERIQLEGDLELWKWSYREKKTSGGSVVFVIDNEPRTESRHMAYVEFQGGRVTRAWRD